MANCLRRRDQNIYSIFLKKIVPLEAPRFSKDSEVEESICQDRLTINNDHQSFWNSRCPKLENIFIFLFFWLYDHEIYSFLETSARFRMIKCLKHKSIYFMHMLTLKKGLHFSKSIFTNENIHDQKTNKNCP